MIWTDNGKGQIKYFIKKYFHLKNFCWNTREGFKWLSICMDILKKGMFLLMECMIFEILLWRDSFHLFCQNFSLIILIFNSVNLPDWKILQNKDYQFKKRLTYQIASKAQREYGFLGNFQYRIFLRLRIHIVGQQTVFFTMTVPLIIK